MRMCCGRVLFWVFFFAGERACEANEIEWRPIFESSVTEGPLWDGWETEDDFMTPRGRDQG